MLLKVTLHVCSFTTTVAPLFKKRIFSYGRYVNVLYAILAEKVRGME